MMVRNISLFRMLNLALLIICTVVNKSLSFQNKSLRSFSPSSDGERVLLYRTVHPVHPMSCPQRLQKRYRPYRSRQRGAERRHRRRHRATVQRCGKARRVAARWRRRAEGAREGRRGGRAITAAHVRWECSLWTDEGRQVSARREDLKQTEW